MLRSRQSETTNASETAQNGGWVFTLVGKDCNNGDTGPAELMYEDRLIAAIKRLLEQDEETTHVEVHEGNVGGTGTGDRCGDGPDHGLSARAVAVWFHRLYSGLGMIGCSSHSGQRTFITRCARKIGEVGGSLRDV